MANKKFSAVDEYADRCIYFTVPSGIIGASQMALTEINKTDAIAK